LPEEEKKQEGKTLRRIEVDLGKYSPPPEPVNVSPFQVPQIKEGLTSPPPEPVKTAPFQSGIEKGLTPPPPEPVAVSAFSQAKTTQTKENSKTEGQQ